MPAPTTARARAGLPDPGGPGALSLCAEAPPPERPAPSSPCPTLCRALGCLGEAILLSVPPEGKASPDASLRFLSP